MQWRICIPKPSYPLDKMSFLNTFGQACISKSFYSLGKDYRSLLKDIKTTGDTHILLDCKTESIQDILKQAQQVLICLQTVLALNNTAAIQI